MYISQVTAYILLCNSNAIPRGVAVPHADRPGCQIIHGLGLVGLGKTFSAKTNGTGEHLREAEEDTVPRSQEGRAWDPETDINGTQNTEYLTGKHQNPGGVPDHSIGPLHIRK